MAGKAVNSGLSKQEFSCSDLPKSGFCLFCITFNGLETICAVRILWNLHIHHLPDNKIGDAVFTHRPPTSPPIRCANIMRWPSGVAIAISLQPHSLSCDADRMMVHLKMPDLRGKIPAASVTNYVDQALERAENVIVVIGSATTARSLAAETLKSLTM
jgi:hypothetical protein